ncbi:MAG: outer membrane beta-barrel protein [Pseudomonadota bacterium]
MRTPILLTTVATTALVIATTASAQDFYGQLYGGITFPDDPTFSGIVGGVPADVDTTLDEGFLIGGSVGLRFASVPNLRAEVELSYGENDIDGINFSGNGLAPEVGVGGDISHTSLLVNGYWDFQTNGPLTPYVGAGLGVGFVDTSAVYGPGVRLDSSDDVFALQLIAGASYDLSESTALFADVRYRQFFDVSADRITPAGGLASVSDDISLTSFNVGVRLNF